VVIAAKPALLSFSMAELGKRNSLTVLRESASGLHLDGGADGEILLPGREIPPGTRLDDQLDVFLYRDSEDRLIATTAIPLVMAGEFAALEVVDYRPGTGAFLNWGLGKDLLLPIREQTEHITIGDHVLVHVYIDRRSERITATMRLDRFLDKSPPNYDHGQPVSLTIANETPLGCKAIVNNLHWGLLYRTDMAFPLIPGQKVEAYVRCVREDGKIDLSLDPMGYQRVIPLAHQILAILESGGGYSPYDDSSSPEEIRDVFQTSKKAFKQALGALFRERLICFEKPGIRLIPHNLPRRR
jgi:predicted RNA-binding protein (virulence factor B family)